MKYQCILNNNKYKYTDGKQQELLNNVNQSLKWLWNPFFNI